MSHHVFEIAEFHGSYDSNNNLGIHATQRIRIYNDDGEQIHAAVAGPLTITAEVLNKFLDERHADTLSQLATEKSDHAATKAALANTQADHQQVVVETRRAMEAAFNSGRDSLLRHMSDEEKADLEERALTAAVAKIPAAK